MILLPLSNLTKCFNLASNLNVCNIGNRLSSSGIDCNRLLSKESVCNIVNCPISFGIDCNRLLGQRKCL